MDRDLPRGAGDADGASRFLFVAVVFCETSGLLVIVLVRARPLRPDDFCCCSESEVTGTGVLGASGLILGGLPGLRLGGFGVSDLFDMTDCDRLMLPAGVTLFSRTVSFAVEDSSRLVCLSGFEIEICGDVGSVSESGLTSRSSRDGLLGLNPLGRFLLFHGVDEALEGGADRLSDLGIGVVFAEAGY